MQLSSASIESDKIKGKKQLSQKPFHVNCMALSKSFYTE